MKQLGWVAEFNTKKRAEAKKASIEARRVGPRIEVTEDMTGEVIEVVTLHANNMRHAQRVERGLFINMNHERFSTCIKDVER